MPRYVATWPMVSVSADSCPIVVPRLRQSETACLNPQSALPLGMSSIFMIN